MVVFFRKNIIFFSVVGVLLAVSVFLLVFDVIMYTEISESNDKTLNAMDKIQQIKKAKNKPVDQNAEMIQEDTEKVKLQAMALERHFGQPFRKYLLIFAKDTGLEEFELLAAFRKHFEEYKVKKLDKEVPFTEEFKDFTAPKDNVFFDFMNQYREKLALLLTQKQAKAACLKAKKEYDENSVTTASPANRTKINTAYKNFFENILRDVRATVENLTSAGIDNNRQKRIREDLFSCSLGLPRSMAPYQCQVYLNNMQREFVNKRLFPGVKDIEKIREFTYPDYVNATPKQKDIPEILQAMPVFEDIARRLRMVDGLQLETMSRGLPTAVSDKYLKYRFKLTVTGKLNDIRKFVNVLHEAYKDNRVYVVSWISLKGETDAELGTLREILVGGEENSNGTARNSKPTGKIEAYKDSLSDLYASPVVGKNTQVRAEIDFDYYIFTGDQVYTYQQAAQ